MARTKDGAPKKKRKNIVQLMMFGNEDKPDLKPEQINSSKWETFKYLFGHRFGTVVALNLLTCIFAIPAVAVIVLSYMNIAVSNGLIPYSANFGIGYPVVNDAEALGVLSAFNYSVFECVLLIPCIMVFALGLAGNFYVMRKLIWEEPTSTVKDFFRGIKKCWLAALVMGLAFGFTILLFIFTLGYFDVYGLPVSLKVVSIILASLLLVFMTIFTAFLLTQNAAFKMKANVLIRNSMLFVFGTNIQSILFIAIAVAPAFLWLIPGITVIVAILYMFLGVSFTTLVSSLYCHYCYEKFLYDKIDRSSAVYAKRPNEIEEARAAESSAQTKKKQPAPYKNPKKRKKSIDEGANITPLTTTFRREDLERLAKEHEEILRESEEDDSGEPDIEPELDLVGGIDDADDTAAVAETDGET